MARAVVAQVALQRQVVFLGLPAHPGAGETKLRARRPLSPPVLPLGEACGLTSSKRYRTSYAKAGTEYSLCYDSMAMWECSTDCTLNRVTPMDETTTSPRDNICTWHVSISEFKTDS